MKLRRLKWMLIALAAIAVFVVFFTDLVDVADFLPKVRFTRTATWASSTVTLETIRAVYEFNTVEYVHRVVFPYDYLGEEISLNGVLAKIRNGGESIEDSLEPEEYLYFAAYSLAEDVGLNPAAERDFVVVTVAVTAGFDLADSPLAADSVPADDLNTSGFAVEIVDTDEGARRVVTISRPSPVVTDIRVEDINRSGYPYPDVPIAAADWARIATFVGERAARLPEINDVLEQAARNGERFVRQLLERGGYDEVRFAVPEL